MRITSEADYALRIVYELARAGEKTDAKTVSERANVPVRFTLKILRKLVLGGVVSSYKGVNGGYMLNASPKEITLLSIIELIDGPLVISKCLDSEYCCTSVGEMKRSCVFHLIFDQINRRLSDKFRAVTLDMITDEQKSIDDILALI